MRHSGPLQRGRNIQAIPKPMTMLIKAARPGTFKMPSISNILYRPTIFFLPCRMKLLQHLHFFPFVIGLAAGIFCVYILKPSPMVITKYPNLENSDIVYRDRNGTCFKYDTKTVECDKVEDRIKPYPLQ